MHTDNDSVYEMYVLNGEICFKSNIFPTVEVGVKLWLVGCKVLGLLVVLGVFVEIVVRHVKLPSEIPRLNRQLLAFNLWKVGVDLLEHIFSKRTIQTN